MVIDKKAQNMSLTTILIMVLGVVVVVLLIWGFSVGWGNFWDTVNPFASKSNIDNIKSACALACSAGGASDYCSLVRDVKMPDDSKLKGSCATLGPQGVASCSAVSCTTSAYPSCDALGGAWEDTCGEKRAIAKSSDMYVASPESHPENNGKFCCEKE